MELQALTNRAHLNNGSPLSPDYALISHSRRWNSLKSEASIRRSGFRQDGPALLLLCCREAMSCCRGTQPEDRYLIKTSCCFLLLCLLAFSSASRGNENKSWAHLDLSEMISPQSFIWASLWGKVMENQKVALVFARSVALMYSYGVCLFCTHDCTFQRRS